MAQPPRFCIATRSLMAIIDGLEMLAAEARRLADITEEVLLTSQLDRGDLRVDQQRSTSTTSCGQQSRHWNRSFRR
jgi:hypothetical protein